MKWRDIESAPKDAMILLAEPHPGGTDIPWAIFWGRWLECASEAPVPGEPTAYRRVPTTPGWYVVYPAIYSGGNPDSASWHPKTLICVRATHWMPMPKPPNVNPDKAVEKRSKKGDRNV